MMLWGGPVRVGSVVRIGAVPEAQDDLWLLLFTRDEVWCALNLSTSAVVERFCYAPDPQLVVVIP